MEIENECFSRMEGNGENTHRIVHLLSAVILCYSETLQIKLHIEIYREIYLQFIFKITYLVIHTALSNSNSML